MCPIAWKEHWMIDGYSRGNKPVKLKEKAEHCVVPNHGFFLVAWYKHSNSVLTRKLKAKHH